MDLGTVYLGFFFIALGFLVKAFPNLIAGYNTMTQEQKKNVDVEGLTTWARNSMVSIGLVLILSFVFFYFTGISLEIIPIEIPIIVIGVIVLIAGAQKFDHN